MNNLQGKAIKGLAWRGGSSIVQFCLTILVTIFLMKLIGPSEYGIVAKLVIVLSFFNIFLNLGVSQALVQQEVYTRENLSSHFAFSLFIAVVLALLLYLSSEFLADFFSEPRLSFPFKLFAGTLFLGGSIMVHRATLHRELKFKQIAIIDFLSMAISALFAIYLALNGHGFIAVVVQMVASSIIQVILYWLLASFRPIFPYFKKADVLATSSFSLFLFLNVIAKYLANLLDQFLISLKFDQVTLGLYNRSVSLIKNPVRLIPSSFEMVLFPLFSRLQNQDEEEKSIQNIFYRSTGMIVLLLSPTLLWLNLYASEILPYVLGEDWNLLIPYVRILSLTGLIYMLNLEGSLFLSEGRMQDWLYINLADKAITIAAIIIGIQYGIITLLYALLLSELISRTIHLYFAVRYFKINITEYVSHLIFPFINAVLFVALGFAFIYFLNLKGITLILSLVVFYVLYLLLNYLLKVNQASKDMALFVHRIRK